MTPEELKKRYKWQCRRGLKEVEVVLEPYLEEFFVSDSPEEQALFGRLLECQDADLFEWFMRRSHAPDEELDAFVDTLLKRLADRY